MIPSRFPSSYNGSETIHNHLLILTLSLLNTFQSEFYFSTFHWKCSCKSCQGTLCCQTQVVLLSIIPCDFFSFPLTDLLAGFHSTLCPWNSFSRITTLLQYPLWDCPFLSNCWSLEILRDYSWSSSLSWILFQKSFDPFPWLWLLPELQIQMSKCIFFCKYRSYLYFQSSYHSPHLPQLSKYHHYPPKSLSWMSISEHLKKILSFNSPWLKISKSYRFKLQNISKMCPPFISIIITWLKTIMIFL